MSKIVAIVNITDDSFSSDGLLSQQVDISQKIQNLVQQGADVIDVGAESTAPGAKPLDHIQEWSRLEKFLPKIVQTTKDLGVELAVDTRHYQTAQKAIGLGIDLVNDVSGVDQNMLDVVRDTSVKIVCMHNLGVPARKDKIVSKNKDIIEVIKKWFEEKLEYFAKNNIAQERVILDPGIGFGKDASQSLEIIRRISELVAIGAPLYVGHSRKSFFNSFTSQDFADRDIETLAASLHLAGEGVDYLRVHNVEMHSRALKVYDAVLCY